MPHGFPWGILTNERCFSLLCPLTHQRDLPGVARQVIGGLQTKRQSPQRGMRHDSGQGL